MVVVEVAETIRVEPTAVLALVMDIDRYAAEVDDKIRPVLWSRRQGDRVEFACRPTLAGLPQPKVVQFVELTPGRRIDIGLLPRPANRLAHAVAAFRASFVVTAVPEGSTVVRRLEFDIAPWARWLLEPLLRRRLPDEVRDEIARAKAVLESAPA